VSSWSVAGLPVAGLLKAPYSAPLSAVGSCLPDLQVRMLKLGSRLTDEQQAQVQFSSLHNALAAVKVQYQQAQTSDLKKFEHGEWLSALNRLGQLPPSTLAGRQAQVELSDGMKEFQALDKLQ
jgi:hypothetical protein